MKILHVVPYFPPDRLGGVGEVAAHLHRSLLERGHDSRVLTTGSSRADPRVLRVAGSPDGFVVGAPLSWRRARSVDVIHVHHGEAAGLLAVLRLLGAVRILRQRPAIVLTLHASAAKIGRSLRPVEFGGRTFKSGVGFFRRTAGMAVRHLLDRGAMIFADRVTFISRSTARDFVGDGRAGEATVVYNGLPDRGEVSGRDRPKRGDGAGSPGERESPDAVELLFVGVYNLRKRVQLLPFVLARVRERIPGARLRLVGFRAEDHPEFFRLARELGVEDGLVLEGPRRSEELPEFYRSARVLLVPSAYEGLPMVILEAFQSGLPCVATRVSGHPEIVEDGKNGILVEPDDPVAMADAAVELLEDPTRVRSMGDIGRIRVRVGFGVERQTDEYLAVYRELVTGGDAGPDGPVLA